ncbi:MAG: biopolymer transporter ExbD [Prolixibacteraceae bacterium]|nr:biopolymer transporter ExbD [Prolixibacteraceae bacterium]MBN2772720.1 biopolymer transporter ExbD [Prolixibacteraceae bacterium]
MSKFKKSSSKELPPISTASLPDIVFMLLFFFMVSTTMREVTLKVQMTLPQATELSKLEKKSLVSYIYVGTPHKQFQKAYGTEPQIQLNDEFATLRDIPDYITAEREARAEEERPLMITSLKVDEFTKMKIVSDLKQELRKMAALHINYSSRKKTDY